MPKKGEELAQNIGKATEPKLINEQRDMSNSGRGGEGKADRT